jgi:hypothetical protein
MKDLFSEAKRHAAVLFEQTQEKLERIAAHVADMSQRLPPRQQVRLEAADTNLTLL